MAKQLHSASKINSKSIHMRTCGHKKLLSDRKSSYPKGERARQIFALSNFLLTPLWKTSTWNHLHNKTLFHGTLLVISFSMSQYALCLQLQNPQSETIQGWKILPSRQNHGIFNTAEGRHPMISFSHLKTNRNISRTFKDHQAFKIFKCSALFKSVWTRPLS